MFRGGKEPEKRIINVRRVHSVGVLELERRAVRWKRRGGAWEDEDISDLAGERCV